MVPILRFDPWNEMEQNSKQTDHTNRNIRRQTDRRTDEVGIPICQNSIGVLLRELQRGFTYIAGKDNAAGDKID